MSMTMKRRSFLKSTLLAAPFIGGCGLFERQGFIDMQKSVQVAFADPFQKQFGQFGCGNLFGLQHGRQFR